MDGSRGTSPDVNPGEIASLLARLRQGDDAAKAEFIAAYDELVRRSVERKLHAATGNRETSGDAEDICHDVYVRLFKNNCEALGKIREPASINAWLMTVSQNHVYSYLRKRQVRHTARESMAREQDEPYEAGPEKRALASEELAMLRERIARLEPKDRLILQLYYVHDLKYAEIAETLSLNINTVASRLMRAKARLRERLIEDSE